jgi:hypothetical protein
MKDSKDWGVITPRWFITPHRSKYTQMTV